MKVTATTAGSLIGPHFNVGAIANHIRHTVQSAATVHRLQEELAAELDAVTASERGADPEFRRDALERAVRRVWGATQ
jgi:hypothetical protein